MTGAAKEWLGVLSGEIEAGAAKDAARVAAQLVARTDATGLRRQVTRLDGRLQKLTVGWTEGLVPDAAYAATRDQLAGEREALVAQARVAEGKARALTRPPAPIVTALLESWDTAEPAALRDLLSGLVARVVVDRPARGPVAVTVVPIEALQR